MLAATAEHSPPALPSPAVRARTALLGAGAATAYVVGQDGSPAWQGMRVTAVAIATGTAWWVMSRSTRARREAVAFVAGCGAAALGVGIGLPHLLKSNVGPLSLAGLVGLVSGLALLLFGGAGLMRMTRPWGRLVTLPGLVLAVVLTLLTLGQAIAATNVPRTPVGATTPEDLGLTFRDVELRTADGVTLSGWYIPSRNHAAIALLHGAGSTRSGVLRHARVLAGHGYGVVLFDARGHGRSGGRAMDFGWHGDQDTSAAVSFLLAQAEVDRSRIAVVGLSMGGEEAIGAGAADPNIAAVVAEGATNRVAGDKAWLPDRFGWRGSLQQGIDWLTYSAVDLLTEAARPIPLREAVRTMAPRPVLLIAGGDVPEESYASRFIQEGSPATVELWIAPDTGHTAALSRHPEDWERRVTTFLATALHLGQG
jgi:pimeloyl-ACP methyl ester carboxylesterase